MTGDIIVVLVVVAALAFDFTNGLHDTANSMATTIATGALPPKVAVSIAAVLNFIGAFISLTVAATVASGIVNGDVIAVHEEDADGGDQDIAGVADRFDGIESGPRTADTVRRVLEELDVPPERALVVDVVPDGLAAGREAGSLLSIAVARSAATPEELRRAGASAIVADLQELLAPMMST